MGEQRRLLDSLLEVNKLVERFQGPHGCSETNAFIFHFFLELLHMVKASWWSKWEAKSPEWRAFSVRSHMSGAL